MSLLVFSSHARQEKQKEKTTVGINGVRKSTIEGTPAEEKRENREKQDHEMCGPRVGSQWVRCWSAARVQHGVTTETGCESSLRLSPVFSGRERTFWRWAADRRRITQSHTVHREREAGLWLDSCRIKNVGLSLIHSGASMRLIRSRCCLSEAELILVSSRLLKKANGWFLTKENMSRWESRCSGLWCCPPSEVVFSN